LAGAIEVLVMNIRLRQAGRPRAIPEALESVVMELYEAGCVYRAIARILEKEHEITITKSGRENIITRQAELHHME